MVWTSLPLKSILRLIRLESSLPVNFQNTPNLLELAMRTCYPKVLKVESPRDFGSPMEAFSFVEGSYVSTGF